MKSRFLAALAVISMTGGCLAPRNDSRPGIIRGLYNRIHGNDVGAPCASGGCAPAYLQAPPAMAPAMAPGCNGCGESMAQYPGYAMEDGFRGANFGGPAYGSEVYGGEMYGDAVVSPGMIGGGVQVSPGVQVAPGTVYESGT